MKKNEFYEGMVTSLKFPNKGIVYVEDEDAYVQVKNTLPGQRVRFQLKKVKKKRPEGNLTEVLVPSEIEKAVPPCVRIFQNVAAVHTRRFRMRSRRS